MRVIAIDPGTSCGYAYTDDGKVHVGFSGVWNLKPDRHSGSGMRYLRVRRYLSEMLDGIEPDQVAVFYEEVRRHAGTDAAHIYEGIVATITAVCEERGITQYQGIPVGTIKKRATGRGNANKQAMIEAANEQFGMVAAPHEGGTGYVVEIKDDIQADALHLLVCGLEELGG